MIIRGGDVIPLRTRKALRLVAVGSMGIRKTKALNAFRDSHKVNPVLYHSSIASYQLRSIMTAQCAGPTCGAEYFPIHYQSTNESAAIGIVHCTTTSSK